MGALFSKPKAPAPAPAPVYDAAKEKAKAAEQEANANRKRVGGESRTQMTSALGNTQATTVQKKTVLGG